MKLKLLLMLSLVMTLYGGHGNEETPSIDENPSIEEQPGGDSSIALNLAREQEEQKEEARKAAALKAAEEYKQHDKTGIIGKEVPSEPGKTGTMSNKGTTTTVTTDAALLRYLTERPQVDVSGFKLTGMVQQGKNAQPVIQKPTGLKGFWERNISHNYTHRMDVLKDLLFDPHLRNYFKRFYDKDFNATSLRQLEAALKGKDKKARQDAENTINSLYREFSAGRTGTAIKRINRIYMHALTDVEDYITEPIVKGNSMAGGKVEFSFNNDGSVELKIYDAARNEPRIRTMQKEEAQAMREIFYGQGPAEFTLKIDDLKKFFNGVDITPKQMKQDFLDTTQATNTLNAKANKTREHLKGLIDGTITIVSKPTGPKPPAPKTNDEIVKEWNSFTVNMPSGFGNLLKNVQSPLADKPTIAFKDILFDKLSKQDLRDVLLAIRKQKNVELNVNDPVYREVMRYISIRKGQEIRQEAQKDVMQLKHDITNKQNVFTDVALGETYDGLATEITNTRDIVGMDRTNAMRVLKDVRTLALNTPMTPESRNQQMKIIGDVRFEDISFVDPRKKGQRTFNPPIFEQLYNATRANNPVKIDFSKPDAPTIIVEGTVWKYPESNKTIPSDQIQVLKNLFEGHLAAGNKTFIFERGQLNKFFNPDPRVDRTLSWGEVIDNVQVKIENTRGMAPVVVPRQQPVRQKPNQSFDLSGYESLGGGYFKTPDGEVRRLG